MSVMAAAAALTLSAAPAHAETSGQDPVSGWSKESCDATGAAQAQQRQNEGYITTFVGCSLSGSPSGPPYQGTVHYRSGGEVGGQDPVSGSTQQSCDAAGAAQAQQRQNEGYTTTFVGCSLGGSASAPPYQGTVYYHLVNY